MFLSPLPLFGANMLRCFSKIRVFSPQEDSVCVCVCVSVCVCAVCVALLPSNKLE